MTSTSATRTRRRTWVPHVVLAVIGVLIMLYPFTLARALPVTCREQVMRPGDVCAKASGGQTQTYEQRVATASRAEPVIVGVGILLFGFGTYLAVTAYRRREGAEPSTAGAQPPG